MAEFLTKLERDVAPAFFDIMVHLIEHLAKKKFICGLVHTQWMYPFKRCFKALKGYIKNLAYTEGNIVQRYQINKALDFAIEYMEKHIAMKCCVWDKDEDVTLINDMVEGKGCLPRLFEDLQKEVHDFVLDNTTILEPLKL